MDIKHLLKYKEDLENKTAHHRTLHFEHTTHYHKQCIIYELYVLYFVKLHSKLYIHAIYYFNLTKSVILFNDTFT